VREKTLESLTFTLNRIYRQDHCVKQYEMPEDKPMMAAEYIADYNRKNKKDV
jgi:DNA mismatch endonuclease (patch repair protein)